MKACCWLLFGLLFLTGSRVNAQTACPPGMTPYGAGVCGYDNSQQQQSVQPLPPQQPPPQWVTQWGAVATDFAHGSAGASVNRISKSDAEQAALAECISNGGSTCRVEVAYDNECVAMTAGDKIHNVTADATIDKAIQSSMKTCSTTDTNCHVYYSACSLPVQIQ